MSLFDQINTDIKKAMLAKDKPTLSALRDIKSKLLLESTSASDSKVTDDIVLKISKKLHKQRIETIEIYTKQGRDDLAEEERVQALVIEKYLPKQLTADEIHEHVKIAIADVDAQGMQDMGKVMGLLSSKIGGMADGKTISAIVKEELS